MPTITTDIGRNYAINALFSVGQRGAGPFTANNVVGIDGFRDFTTNDTMSVTLATLSDADRTAIGDEEAVNGLQNVFVGSATAGSFNLVRHAIEAVRRLAGDTVTVSFWAKAASGTPKLGISFVSSYGTGGSTPVVTAGQPVTLSTTWTRYSNTFVVPTAQGKTLTSDNWSGVKFWFSAEATNATEAGSIGVQSGTVTLWGVQVEVGSSATALEKRSRSEELIRCQRFYQIGNVTFFGLGGVSTSVSYSFALPVTMSDTPTMTSNFGTSTNATGATMSSPSAGYVTTAATTTAAAGFGLVGTFTASAEF